MVSTEFIAEGQAINSSPCAASVLPVMGVGEGSPCAHLNPQAFISCIFSPCFRSREVREWWGGAELPVSVKWEERGEQWDRGRGQKAVIFNYLQHWVTLIDCVSRRSELPSLLKVKWSWWYSILHMKNAHTINFCSHPVTVVLFL